MANYLSLANELQEKKNSLNNDYDKINTILTSLKENYTGQSATKLESDLETSLEQLKGQIGYIEGLSKVLKLIDTHKSNVKTLNDYKNKRDNWSSLDPLESNPYTSRVSDWEKKVSDVAKKIKGNIPAVSKIASSISLISPNIDFSYRDYATAASTNLKEVKSGLNVSMNISYQGLIDMAVNEWLDGFKDNKYGLKTKNLASCGYTASEVDAIIAERTMGATPREKSVITALTLIELGITGGVKTPYILSKNFFNSVSKPFDTEALINNGVDCASCISYVLNKSSSKTFNNATPETIKEQGKKTDYENLAPGDVVGNYTHVAMVVYNDPDDEYVVVADASGHETGGYTDGYRVQKIKYSALKNSLYTGYDFSNFYAQSV